MLSLSNVCAGYGDTAVLSGVSLEVKDGEAVALLGRNGMGKTTCLLAIMGLNPARTGSIRFNDSELRGVVRIITAEVPLSEMFGYTTVLRGMTQGRATSTMEPAAYRLMPDRLRDEVLAKA